MFQLHLGDCEQTMLGMESNSVDAIVTDPPYELGFMGKSWDASGIAYSVEMWREALRVLKPGGHLLAFSGSRTYHRMVCAIEDAGFEIRDQIMWVYGSGFPKSLDVSKAIDKAAGAEREVIGERKKLQSYGEGVNEVFGGGPDKNGVQQITAPATEAARQWQGWGTALKPAHEPIVVARKPLIGTVAANVLQHGTGAINVDGCRVTGEPVRTFERVAGDRPRDQYRTGTVAPGSAHMSDAGRWPANLIHDGSDEVVAAFPQAPGQMATASTSDTQRAGQNVYGQMVRGSNGSEPRVELDKSAARFFYAAKSSKRDRNSGCEGVMTWENVDLQPAQQVVQQLQKATSDISMLLRDDSEWSTTLFGSEPTARFLPAIRSIIETIAKQTTDSTTSNCSVHWSIRDIIRAATETAETSGSNLANFAEYTSPSRLNTTCEKTASAAGAVHAALRTLCDANKSAKHGNVHSTVKPTDLMRYLVRLVTPPGGTVLDPFTGSGSTGRAAMLEGFRFIGCELSPEYLAIADARIGAAACGGFA